MFWYDANGELRQHFDDITIEGVEFLLIKMLGVVCRCEGEISAILYAPIENYFRKQEAPSGTSPGDIYETLVVFGLENYLWKLISAKFGITGLSRYLLLKSGYNYHKSNKPLEGLSRYKNRRIKYISRYLLN